MMMRTQQHGDDRRQGKVPECNGGDLGERCVIVHDPAGDENVRAGGRVRRMGPQSGSQARARACLAALTARNRSIRELLPQVGVSQGHDGAGQECGEEQRPVPRERRERCRAVHNDRREQDVTACERSVPSEVNDQTDWAPRFGERRL